MLLREDLVELGELVLERLVPLLAEEIVEDRLQLFNAGSRGKQPLSFVLVEGFIDDSLVLVTTELVQGEFHLLEIRVKPAISHHALVA